MKKDKKIVLCFTIIFFFLIFINKLSTAAMPQFQIRPSRFELFLKSRQRNIETIKIKNMGEKTLKLVATAKDWDIDSKGDLKLKEGETTPRSASNWIRFNPKKIKVEPGKTQFVRFSITVPPNVEPGEYRTTILLTAQKKFTSPKAQIQIQPQFATLVYTNIPEVIRKGEIKGVKIEVDKKNYYAKGNIYSKGNAHLRITGEYILKNSKDEKVITGDMGKKVILAGDEDQFIADLGKLEKGSYNLELIWHYIPAFYMKGKIDEYPGEEENLVKKYKFSVD